MDKKKLYSDKQLREKLDDFSVQPPPLIWDNIKGQLAAKGRKKRMAYFAWISAAAVVVLAFLAGWYFNNNSEITMPLTVEQQTIQHESGGDESVAQESKVISTNEDVDQLLETHNLPSQNRRELITENTLFESEIEPKKSNSVDLSVSTFEKIKMRMMKRLEANVESKKFENLLAEHSNHSIEYKLNEVDKYLIAANKSNFKPGKRRETGWKMGLHISPEYSSNVSSHSDIYSQNMTYSSENGNGNVGGGFSIQYKTSKKLSVESGIYYAQSGQKSGNSFELFAFKNRESNAIFAPGNDYDYLSAIQPASPAFSNSVNVDNGNIAMNSTAGIIEMSGTPKGAQIASDFETAKYGFSDRLVSDGEFSQVFDFIEIPLYLRYSIIDSKLGIELMGGVNAGLVVGNNAYIDNSFGLQNIGETQDISMVNLSGTVGIGVNYDLGKHVSIAVEPRLNYYLNSINSNPEVDFHPYRVGIYTGVYYEF